MVMNKYYNKVRYSKKFEMYDFEFFDVEKIDFFYGEKKKYRIGKFISLIYKKCIRSRNKDDRSYLNRNGFVYVSKREIEDLLGIRDNLKLIRSLSKSGLIKFRREGRSKYDYNKKLWFFKLDDRFYSCKKSRIKIEDDLLNRRLDKLNVFKKKKLGLGENIEVDKLDKFVLYELYSCKNSNLNIQNLDEVIENRIENKLNEIRDRVSWIWISNKKRNKELSKISELENWKDEYRIELRNKYEIIIEDLDNLKNGNYIELSESYFKRDNYGKRLYNLYSRVIREYRDYVKIDNEDVVELDIKSCMISLLYVFIKELNKESVNSNLIVDVKDKLLKLNNGSIENRNGSDFIDKYKIVFDGNGVFWSDKNEIEFDDYYDFIRVSYGIEMYRSMSRRCFKDLLWSVLFSGKIKSKGIKIGKENIDKIELRLLGNSGKKLINDIKKIDLRDWIKDKGGRRKKYDSGKNVSLILMMMENNLMDMIRDKLIDEDIKFISVFDSLMIKKSEGKKVLKMVNKMLSVIDNSLKFRMKLG
tara:strand:- start:1812 stop:3398 length:1587 start_codon:yes stop_codon:yes gene_type:complete